MAEDHYRSCSLHQLSFKKENVEHGGEQWRTMANDVGHGGRIL